LQFNSQCIIVIDSWSGVLQEDWSDCGRACDLSRPSLLSVLTLTALTLALTVAMTGGGGGTAGRTHWSWTCCNDVADWETPILYTAARTFPCNVPRNEHVGNAEHGRGAGWQCRAATGSTETDIELAERGARSSAYPRQRRNNHQRMLTSTPDAWSRHLTRPQIGCYDSTSTWPAIRLLTGGSRSWSLCHPFSSFPSFHFPSPPVLFPSYPFPFNSSNNNNHHHNNQVAPFSPDPPLILLHNSTSNDSRTPRVEYRSRISFS